MKSLLYLLTVVVAINIGASQQPSTTSPPPPAGSTADDQQKNAASATKDNSGMSGDQVAKAAGAKGSTLIGCLSGPNADGNYALTSMQHRTGVQVLGPDELKKDSGSKVKLTGTWEADPQQQSQAKAKGRRRFQVTAVEVMSPNCKPPTDKTPISKEKQREREQQEQQKPPQ